MTAPTEKNPAAIETAGLEIAIQRQREGSADPGEKKSTTAAGAVEKAAPIPADVEKLANDLLAIANASVRADGSDIPLGETCRKAALVLADRASQEERIREDERDWLYEAADRQHRKLSPRAFIGWQGGMFPFERARLRGDAS